ncbi:YaaL family protein [Amphibacillus jilinensis]|uniref:YaaL family protein n=1 Tax=Amphibacillus jilinensis TaxID=1216008 RepID=UPI0002D91E9A|nr:YaaL family protein [Amphibacillus jilinensis]
MAFGKRKKLKEREEQLLRDIFQLQSEWMKLKNIIEKSVEPSEIGRYDLMVAQAKYFFLLREARYRNINARHL